MPPGRPLLNTVWKGGSSCAAIHTPKTGARRAGAAPCWVSKEEEEGCYTGCASDYVATKPSFGRKGKVLCRTRMEGTHSTERREPNTTGICRGDCLKGGDHGQYSTPEKHATQTRDHGSKKKKGVTRVSQATTSQLNPATEGHSQYEKGNHQDKTPPLKACIARSAWEATTSRVTLRCNGPDGLGRYIAEITRWCTLEAAF